ncbi:steroid receptor RNA activator 1-like [Adelges cooleyi]|uniref:steroid receptor RNA activator 1-like n=1 Tax=Adelges cooleyi TaxID=133065 RepID=UPI00218038BC|nr:steroid receptor RNA activator 1-like [Adelges cooleyi]
MSEGFKPYTPGWNDPPSYSFEDSVSAQQKNRPKIFDRIPARVIGNSQESGHNDEPNQVLLNANNCSASNVLNPTETSLQTSDISVEQRLPYVITSLNESIQKSSLTEPKKVDISKRLSRLESSWNDSQFTDVVQQKTVALVKAIESGNFAEANRLQMALMVDHTRQCNTWIPAIRQLINQHI